MFHIIRTSTFFIGLNADNCISILIELNAGEDCFSKMFPTRFDTEDCIVLLAYFLFKLFKTFYFKDSLANRAGKTLTNCSSYDSSLSVLSTLCK